MDIYGVAILAVLGLFSGLLAGVMGLGGGVVLVPLIQALGYSPVQAVATSSLAIFDDFNFCQYSKLSDGQFRF